MYLPDWLIPLLGNREKSITDHPGAKIFCVDNDDNRLPMHQKIISSPLGEFVIDSHKRQIVG